MWLFFCTQFLLFLFDFSWNLIIFLSTDYTIMLTGTGWCVCKYYECNRLKKFQNLKNLGTNNWLQTAWNQSDSVILLRVITPYSTKKRCSSACCIKTSFMKNRGTWVRTVKWVDSWITVSDNVSRHADSHSTLINLHSCHLQIYLSPSEMLDWRTRQQSPTRCWSMWRFSSFFLFCSWRGSRSI